MEPISKTMHKRLAAQQNAGEHPDADLLTAYAENALAKREREGVISHLARCRSCREIVAMAAPAMPALVPVMRERRWFMRPVIRWAAAVAAVIVVGAAVTLNYESPRSQLATTTEVSGPIPAPRQALPAEEKTNPAAPAATAKVTTPESVPKSSLGVGEANSRVVPGQSAATEKKSARTATVLPDQPGLAKKSDRLDSSVPVRREYAYQNAAPVAAFGGPQQRNGPAAQTPAPPPPPPLRGMSVETQSAMAPLAHVPVGPAKEQVEVSAAAPVVGTVGGTPAPSADSISQARTKSPAVMKAEVPAARPRPAISAGNAGLAARQTEAVDGVAAKNQVGYSNTVPNAACAIIGDGIRCIHNNHKVEMHQPAANLKVIVSLGDTVWAGGDALVRSDDGGTTWVDVQKPSAEAIRQISIMPDGVYVSGPSGAMWRTTDNGASWAQTSANKAPENK